jgi:hypothetical protein
MTQISTLPSSESITPSRLPRAREILPVGDVPANMGYVLRLRSLSLANETLLCHNYNIPVSERLHFPGPDGTVFSEPGLRDICLNRRILMAGFLFPLQLIIRELLTFLQLSPFQVLPNGWRLFLGSYMT